MANLKGLVDEFGTVLVGLLCRQFCLFELQELTPQDLKERERQDEGDIFLPFLNGHKREIDVGKKNLCVVKCCILAQGYIGRFLTLSAQVCEPATFRFLTQHSNR